MIICNGINISYCWRTWKLPHLQAFLNNFSNIISNPLLVTLSCRKWYDSLPSTTSIHFRRTLGIPFQLVEDPSEATEQGESKIGTLEPSALTELLPTPLLPTTPLLLPPGSDEGVEASTRTIKEVGSYKILFS